MQHDDSELSSESSHGEVNTAPSSCELSGQCLDTPRREAPYFLNFLRKDRFRLNASSCDEYTHRGKTKSSSIFLRSSGDVPKNVLVHISYDIQLHSMPLHTSSNLNTSYHDGTHRVIMVETHEYTPSLPTMRIYPRITSNDRVPDSSSRMYHVARIQIIPYAWTTQGHPW